MSPQNAHEPRTRRAPRTAHPTFSGFPWPTKLIGPLLLGLSPLLYFFNLGDPQVLGVCYALAFILIAIVFASWPALEAAHGRGLGALLVGFAVLSGAAAALPLLWSVYPGAPLAELSLAKRDGAKALTNVPAGRHQVVVHVAFDESGRDVNAGYSLRIQSGNAATDLEGTFQSRRARGRAGRQSVDVVKSPLAWNRHEVTLSDPAPTVSLVKSDPSLGDALELRVYAALPLALLAGAAGLLLLFAAAIAARLASRDARMFYVGGVAAMLLTSVIGSLWAWLGEPLLPQVGASFVGIVGGFVVARALLRVVPLLAWAKK